MIKLIDIMRRTISSIDRLAESRIICWKQSMFSISWFISNSYWSRINHITCALRVHKVYAINIISCRNALDVRTLSNNASSLTLSYIENATDTNENTDPKKMDFKKIFQSDYLHSRIWRATQRIAVRLFSKIDGDLSMKTDALSTECVERTKYASYIKVFERFVAILCFVRQVVIFPGVELKKNLSRYWAKVLKVSSHQGL